MKKISVVCCSVVRREVESILANDFPELETIFLDSMLHMHPEKLGKTLEKTLEKLNSPALIIYGDCSPEIHSIENRHICARTPGINCCDLILGQKRYRSNRNERSFLLLPEWTSRWKQVFQQELGFHNAELAQAFMHEHSSSIKYLDTGLIPVPEQTLREISDFFAMPVLIEKSDMVNLRTIIGEALKRLKERCSRAAQPA